MSEENVEETLKDPFRGVEIESDNVDRRAFQEGDVIEEYDVDEFSTVKIMHYDKTDEQVYKVVMPELDDFEALIREEVSQKIVDALKYEGLKDRDLEDMEKTVRDKAERILQTYIKPGSTYLNKISSAIPFGGTALQSLTEESVDKILYYIVNDLVHYGKITPIMNDDYIEDVSCDAPNMPIFVYHSEYRDLMTNIAYEEKQLDAFIRTMAQAAGKHISIADPMIDGSLPDGSRVQLTLGQEVTGDGSNFTIRKFEEIPFTPVDLIQYNTFSLEQMAYLWLAIENNRSLIFSGGTASGKTTSMNAVSLFIPPGSKTITIEDTREISLRQNNWIKSVTRDAFGGGDTGEIGMYELLEAALRQRPEYLIVGEIRGEEAKTLFQAMSTGHTTYSTMHADSVDNAIHRLENPPINVPRMMISSLDILCIQNQTFVDGDRVRRNENITEITGVESRTQNINTKDIFSWNSQEDSFDQVGQSEMMETIRKTRAWSQEELSNEIQMRKEALEYMVENDITDYFVVTDIIRAFILDPERVIELIRDDKIKRLTQESEEVLEEAAESSDDVEVEEVTDNATEPESLEDVVDDGDDAIDTLGKK